MASVIVETEYAAELAGARFRLAALKERAAKRARLRGESVPQPADKDALAGQHPNGGLGERHSAAQAPADAKPAGAALQRLIAAMLLDAASAVPMDSAKLHREVHLAVSSNPKLYPYKTRATLPKHVPRCPDRTPLCRVTPPKCCTCALS
jgi:hypothetical protein